MACWVIAHCSRPLASNSDGGGRGEEGRGGKRVKEWDNEREVSLEEVQGRGAMGGKGGIAGWIFIGNCLCKVSGAMPILRE